MSGLSAAGSDPSLFDQVVAVADHRDTGSTVAPGLDGPAIDDLAIGCGGEGRRMSVARPKAAPKPLACAQTTSDSREYKSAGGLRPFQPPAGQSET